MSTSTAEGPRRSIIVTNIYPSSDPPTNQVLSDFFSFCGPIVSLDIVPSTTDNSIVTAKIVFETEAAAKTATLLSSALIHDRPISVELAPPEDTPLADPNAPQSTLPDEGSTTIFGDVLSKGYQLGADALQQAKKLDEETGVTSTLSSGLTVVTTAVTGLDQEYQISSTVSSLSEQFQNKAKEVDTQYQISTKVQEAGQQVGTFVNVAAATASTGVATATEVVQNIVQSPPVTQGIEGIKVVGSSIGTALESGWNALWGTPKE